ncbi:shikimate dehydrogenase [Halobacillus yeomjeoni]|uniref:shikimate dehydrogenase n=1 Tax=Halobacillus yeomjeoni TaxID=311194 RepID=UPI001CD711E1|nr:shikimate dehydrogenase [Halobacillus yeomjeoni]MCA0982677.1 shikimate dehydrogenase [Halobacillus yeomjeoni]
MLKLGLIGYPIQHSLSPWIHEQLMAQQNVKGSYELFEIQPENFNQEIKSLKNSRLDGFNVTVPYKEKIIPYLDEIDESARALGAVNTVKCKGDQWIGYNTDGLGFVDSLIHRYPESTKYGNKALILGSGGAARGIYHALADTSLQRVDLANRTIERAEEIIQDRPVTIQSNALDLHQASERMVDYDLIIQTTTVGMSPDTNVVVPIKDLKEGAVVCDIVYRPIKTKFLKTAQKHGASLHFGHEMLLQQAVYAFKIWTQTKPEAEPLLSKFEEKLKGV